MLRNVIEPAVPTGERLTRSELFNELASLYKRFPVPTGGKPEGKEAPQPGRSPESRIPTPSSRSELSFSSSVSG